MSDDANSGEGQVSKQDYEREVQRARNMEAQLKEFEKRFEGIDPEEAKANRQALKDLEAQQAGDPKKIEQIVEAARNEERNRLGKQIEDLKSERDSAFAKVKEFTIVDKVFKSAATKFVPGAHEDVKDWIRRYCDLGENGQVVVKGPDGTPLFSKKNGAQPMAPEEFVEWMVEQRPHWAAPTTQSGTMRNGEVSTNGKHSALPTATDFATMSPAEQQRVLSAMSDEQVIQFTKQFSVRRADI